MFGFSFASLLNLALYNSIIFGLFLTFLSPFRKKKDKKASCWSWYSWGCELLSWLQLQIGNQNFSNYCQSQLTQLSSVPPVIWNTAHYSQLIGLHGGHTVIFPSLVFFCRVTRWTMSASGTGSYKTRKPSLCPDGFSLEECVSHWPMTATRLPSTRRSLASHTVSPAKSTLVSVKHSYMHLCTNN